MKNQEHQIITYHGSGIVTRQTVEGTPDEDLDLSTLTQEDEEEDPVFAAIVKLVVRKVQEA